MARAQGARAQMALAFETVYGTPPGSGYTQMPFITSSLAAEQPLLASELLGYGRDPRAPLLDAITTDGDVEVPIDAAGFGFWLKAAFGSPTTAGTVAATGAITFSAQPAVNSTLTINGTAFTFVASGATGNQVNIGANLAATMTALAVALNASVVAGVALATYSGTATALTMVFDVLGSTGNTFTLAASVSPASNGTVSAATLTGGMNSHTFMSGSWTLPSMSIEVGMPEVPRFADPRQFDWVQRANPHPAFADRPVGQQFQCRVQPVDEIVDAGDDAVQHRLDSRDQPVRGLEREITDGAGQTAPDCHRRIIGSLEDRRRPVPETDHARDGAFERPQPRRLQPLPASGHVGKGGVERQTDARPDLRCQITQQPEGFAHAANTGHKLRELIDQFPRADDQRTDPGPDQRPAQEHECVGEAAYRQGGNGQERGVGEAHLDLAGQSRNGRVSAVDLGIRADGLDPIEVVGIGQVRRDDVAQGHPVTLDRAVEMAEPLQGNRGGCARSGGPRNRLPLRHQHRLGTEKAGSLHLPGERVQHATGIHGNPFEGAATAAGAAAADAFSAALSRTYLEPPDLGLGAMADDARARADGYREAAGMLADAAGRPLASWQALRDAVTGTGSDAETALADAASSADALNTELGDTAGAAGSVGAAARDAGAEAAAGADQAATGWGAVTAALADYASKARDIGGDIGSALVGAFTSAENAVGEFVKTGKLDFRDLVTSMIADLAKLAARTFILGPIANALSGALGGTGGIFANILHAGGVVGAPGPGRMVPALAFAGAPRMHAGGWAGIKPDEVPAILQRGERVLSRREAAGYGQGSSSAPAVNVTIMARDAESFRQSRTQVASDIARAVSLGRRGM